MKKSFLSVLLVFSMFFSVCFTTLAGDIIDENENLLEMASQQYSVDTEKCTLDMMAGYFSQNMDKVEEVFDMAYPEQSGTFHATSIEFQIPVYIVSLNEMGLFLDFDGNNGYLVLKDNAEIVEWQNSGDLEYLKDLEYTYYSVFDGFGYYENGEFISYREFFWESECVDILEDEWLYGSNAGGEIIESNDLQTYLNDTYGTPAPVISEGPKSLPDFEYFTQSELTLYTRVDENGTEYTEGNCCLVSAFTLLNYLESSGLTSGLLMSIITANINPENDPFFSKYSERSDYVVAAIRAPGMYKILRDIAVQEAGYEVGGFPFSMIGDLMEATAERFGAYVDTATYPYGSYQTRVVDRIDAGYPVIFNTLTSETYGNHSMVVNGYSIYKQSRTALGVTVTDYIKILQVQDGWSAEPRYFDFTSYSGWYSFVTAE